MILEETSVPYVLRYPSGALFVVINRMSHPYFVDRYWHCFDTLCIVGDFWTSKEIRYSMTSEFRDNQVAFETLTQEEQAMVWEVLLRE